ncbi:transcobalamin-2 [Megalops cyprinoides]|uniref:transcobalamin-2 n=1 Tax=Megalops cyprinoides TaxID=118141 RepID=UPI001864FC47|nr:transcobalamin-2 [Megalops cyprinoides]
MNFAFFLGCALFALVTGKPCDPLSAEHEELILSFNKKLLLFLEDQSTLPNPSVHLALRLSTYHNLGMESAHLVRLKTDLHDNLESLLTKHQPVTGLLALYVLALRASCTDLSSLKINQEPILVQLKRQMELEKDHISASHRPLTNYYQYSLGVLALCASGVRVSSHVSHKLVRAVEQGKIKHGESECIDTLAMAGMALQCHKEFASAQDMAQLEQALSTIKQKLLDSQRPDGHMGNEFSTGLAVQALLAMGSQVSECSASIEAIRTDIKKGTYHNPMAISQTLPALQQKSYLHVKTKECRGEDDSLVVGPKPTLPEPSSQEVSLQVEVITSDGSATTYSLEVPKSSSLLDSLKLLQEKQNDFTFETESSLWGPFLSVVNKERARQADRSYWHLSSDGASLTQGIGDYKIEKAQKITIKKTSY